MQLLCIRVRPATLVNTGLFVGVTVLCVAHVPAFGVRVADPRSSREVGAVSCYEFKFFPQ